VAEEGDGAGADGHLDRRRPVLLVFSMRSMSSHADSAHCSILVDSLSAAEWAIIHLSAAHGPIGLHGVQVAADARQSSLSEGPCRHLDGR
jgi:hypothetical protein